MIGPGVGVRGPNSHRVVGLKLVGSRQAAKARRLEGRLLPQGRRGRGGNFVNVNVKVKGGRGGVWL